MSRRRHKAAGGRIAVTGLSAGAVLGIVGALGANAVPSTSHSRRVALVAPRPQVRARPPSPPTTIVWRVVHRVVYVTDPPATTTGTVSSATAAHAYRATPYAAVAAASPSAAAPAASPAPAPAPAPAPRPAPMPVCSGTKCP